MKWNDIRNRLMQSQTSVTTPLSVAPVSVSSGNTMELRHRSLRGWYIAAGIIALVAIIIAVVVMIWSQSRPKSPLSPADVQYVQEFFDANPPTPLTESDKAYIQEFLYPKPESTPTKTPTTSAVRS